MADFDREFRLEKLAGPDGQAAPNWFLDMLSLWRPAGQPAGDFGLRLAVRNGYLNFYRNGQSVARVGFGRGGRLQAQVHVKYVADGGKGQHYARLLGSSLTCREGEVPPYRGLATLKEWIDRSAKHSGDEKKFVDRVVARNPEVIDLEMGLPAYAPSGQKRVAPRMDLVALEPIANGHRLVFWEAKLMRDGRLRARGAALPEVISQLSGYRRRLEHPGNMDLVKSAYRRNCAVLFNLHKIARRTSKEVGGLARCVTDVLERGISDVDPMPRLLISGQSDSWEPHAAKLDGIKVHHVPSEDGAALSLPLAA